MGPFFILNYYFAFVIWDYIKFSLLILQLDILKTPVHW